jgi:stage II sporulation protein M
LRAHQRTAQLLRPPPAVLLAVAGFLVMGVITGALAIRSLQHSEKDELVGYVDVFLRGLAREPATVNAREVAQLAALNQAKTAAVLWFLGLTIIGIPLIAVVVLVRGFVLGFAVGFLVQELGYRGVLLASAAVLPHNLLAVPLFVLLAGVAVQFSSGLIRHRPARAGELGGRALRYSLVCLALSCGLLLTTLVEAYVSPVFLRAVSRLWP